MEPTTKQWVLDTVNELAMKIDGELVVSIDDRAIDMVATFLTLEELDGPEFRTEDMQMTTMLLYNFAATIVLNRNAA